MQAQLSWFTQRGPASFQKGNGRLQAVGIVIMGFQVCSGNHSRYMRPLKSLYNTVIYFSSIVKLKACCTDAHTKRVEKYENVLPF